MCWTFCQEVKITIKEIIHITKLSPNSSLDMGQPYFIPGKILDSFPLIIFQNYEKILFINFFWEGGI